MSDPFQLEVNLVKLAPVVWSDADSPFLTNNRKWSQGSWRGRILIWLPQTVCPTNLLSPVTVPCAGRSELNFTTVYQVVLVVVSGSHVKPLRCSNWTTVGSKSTSACLHYLFTVESGCCSLPLCFSAHGGIWTDDLVFARRLITSFSSF